MLTPQRLTDLAPGAIRWPRLRWVLVCLVLLHGALSSRLFFPDLFGLGVDESEFIQNGRLTANAWLHGRWVLPEYAYNPLGTLLYLALYVPVAQSPDWFMLVLWTSRILLFLGLWTSLLLVAWELRAIVPPLVVAALAFVAPVHQALTSSEALFAMLAGLAFWQLLRYQNNLRQRHLLAAGALVGLAGLARNDGVVLLVLGATLLFAVDILRRREFSHGVRTAFGTSVRFVLPGAAILAGYLAVQGALAGEFDPSLGKRSYLAFEQGQGVAFSGQQQAWFTGIWEARALYGSPEENGYSVPRAIARNPRAFLKRAVQSVSQLPFLVMLTYGGGTGVVVVGLAAGGLAWLLRRRQWTLALLLAAWPLHLLVYVAFFYRPGYLFMPFFCLLALAAIGVWHGSAALAGVWGRWVSLLSLAIGVAAGLLSGIAAFVSNGATIAGGLWLYRRAGVVLGAGHLLRLAAVTMVLAVLLIMRVPYEAGLPQLRATGGEQAAVFLTTALPRDSVVAALSREVAWIAKMQYASLLIDLTHPDAAPLVFRDAQELRDWVQRSSVRAIYLSDVTRWLAPETYRLIESEIGRDYREVFSVTVLPADLKRRFVDIDASFTPGGRHRVVVPAF